MGPARQCIGPVVTISANASRPCARSSAVPEPRPTNPGHPFTFHGLPPTLTEPPYQLWY